MVFNFKRWRRRATSKYVLDIPSKATKILNFIFLVFLAIGLRLWILCIIQHEQRTQEVLRPRQKILIDQAKRGGIYDRFGEPLAINKIQYKAGVFYAPIREIPSIKWKKTPSGKKIKTYPRRDHIAKISSMMGNILNMDARRIEDLIHSKASILFDTPFILKEEIDERQYYQLKTLENQYGGIYAGISSKRFYPKGKVAGNILGYMGAINRNEYESINQERADLEKYLKYWEMGFFPPLPKGMNSVMQVRSRIKELKERCYSVYDFVGKSGIEANFDESLRGYYGRNIYYTNAKGNTLKYMPTSQNSLPGKRISLTISAQLQEHAEKLLIENEKIREGRSIKIDPTNGTYVYQKQPWIKGGAIVVLDPKTGEVLALASCPRFDPNDFILIGNKEQKEKKNERINMWFENDSYIEKIWNHRANLNKEVFERKSQSIVEKEYLLSWDFFLDIILAKDSIVKEHLKKVQNIRSAIELQTTFERLMQLSNQKNAWNLLKVLYKDKNHIGYPTDPLSKRHFEKIEASLNLVKDEVSAYRRILDYYLSAIPSNYDKLLLVDLCKLNVDSNRFNSALIEQVGDVLLPAHRDFEGAYCNIQHVLKQMSKELFHELEFMAWRETHQKSFLKEKRKEEKANRKYAKPYIDYLDQKELELFEEFWDDHKDSLLIAFLSGQMPKNINPKLLPFLNHFKLWASEISKGAHHSTPWINSYKKLHELFEIYPAITTYQYLLTLRDYQSLDRPLYGSYRNVYPSKKPLERDLARSFYPRHGYSFARSYAFSQSTPQGSLFKLVTAYEALRQKYYKSGGNKETSLNPLTIVDDLHHHKNKQKGWNVGFRTNGEIIPQIYKGGRLPRSHRRGIGKLDLIDAIAVSSNPYFSLLASDFLEDEEDLNRAAANFSFGQKTGIDLPGEISGNLPEDLKYNRTALYSYAIGHHTLVVTPLHSAVMLSAIANGGNVLKPEIIRSLEGMSISKNPSFTEKNEYAFKTSLALLGIDFPLFTAKERGEAKGEIIFQSKVKRTIDMPTPVQRMLFKAMYESVHSSLGSANPDKVRSYSAFHSYYQDYQDLQNQIIGKTSSAEIRENIDLDLYKGINLYKHVSFGAIIFNENCEKNKFGDPELVVIVYLRYGDFGREAAPLVASIAKKWREIKKEHPLTH